MLESSDEFVPASEVELSRWLAENAAGPGRAVFPVGGRTALHFGYPTTKPGITLCTSRLNGLVDYPSRDMTVTVGAGMRVDELSDLLRTERQRLPIDVAQSHRATLGGLIATNTSGSHRYGLGTIRDYLIGISAVDSGGRLFHAGGRVVKNVAGYDLCKMLVGSLGTLAVVTQVTLKLRPEPESTAILWCEFDRWESIELALEKLNKSETRPVALDILDVRGATAVVSETGMDLPHALPVLCVGVEGSHQEVAWQREKIQSELLPLRPARIAEAVDDDARKVWFALTDFEIPSDDPVTFKANLLPSRTVEFLRKAQAMGVTLLSHAGNGIVVGHLPDSVKSAVDANKTLSPLQSLAREARGNLVILHCDNAWQTQFPLMGVPEPSWNLMQTLKKQLDPRDLLNPGRLFGKPERS